MLTLPQTNSRVGKEFIKGCFDVLKTRHPFSSIGTDHAYEQYNQVVNGDGDKI